MSSSGSVTHWLVQLKAGDHAAAEPLWERYYRRLIRMVRRRLNGTARRAADEEDVVLSAFDSLIRGARAGRFPRLSDRDDLWRLLITISERKAIDLRKHETAQKRHGGVQLSHDVPDPSPTPEFAMQVAEEYRGLMDCLKDDNLRAVAQLKLEGYTNVEIVARVDCLLRTVERRLRLIRSIWSKKCGVNGDSKPG